MHLEVLREFCQNVSSNGILSSHFQEYVLSAAGDSRTLSDAHESTLIPRGMLNSKPRTPLRQSSTNSRQDPLPFVDVFTAGIQSHSDQPT